MPKKIKIIGELIWNIDKFWLNFYHSEIWFLSLEFDFFPKKTNEKKIIKKNVYSWPLIKLR